MTLEAIVLRRAEEQLSAGAWKRADHGEHLVSVPPPTCLVCGKDASRPARGRPTAVPLCRHCITVGHYRSRLCGCGFPLRTSDYARGTCWKCLRRDQEIA